MKRINCFHYIVACMLLMCITACDKENSTIEDEIPAAIKSDFSKRYPSAEITSFMNYSDGIDQIKSNNSPLKFRLLSCKPDILAYRTSRYLRQNEQG